MAKGTFGKATATEEEEQAPPVEMKEETIYQRMARVEGEIRADQERQQQEIAARTTTEVEAYDYGEDSGAGMEDVSMDERRLPMLRILDPKSPQCKPVAQGGLPGARGGALLNTSTSEVYDGEIGGEFIPCYRDQKFIEWIKKNDDGSGGGFVSAHEPDEPLVHELRAKHGKFGKLPMGTFEHKDQSGAVSQKPHELAQTFYLYGTFYPPGAEPFRCMLPFQGMQIKKYQDFVSKYDNIRYKTPDGRSIKPPIWAHRLAITTQYESRGSQSWYGYIVGFAEKNEDGTENRDRSRLSLKDERYVSAKEFYQQIAAGEVKPDYKADAPDDGGSAGAGTAREAIPDRRGEFGPGPDEPEIPY